MHSFSRRLEGGRAITRSIVEWRGGGIWAISNSGRGGTLRFTLPSKLPAAARVVAILRLCCGTLEMRPSANEIIICCGINSLMTKGLGPPKHEMGGDPYIELRSDGRRYEAVLRLSEALSVCTEPEDLTKILSEQLREFLDFLQFYIIV